VDAKVLLERPMRKRFMMWVSPSTRLLKVTSLTRASAKAGFRLPPALRFRRTSRPEDSEPRSTVRRPERRRDSTGRPRPASAVRASTMLSTPWACRRAENRRGSYPRWRSLPRRVRMRVGDRCQAHRCAGGRVGSTRITETELARDESPRRFSRSAGLRWWRDEATLGSPWPAPDGRGRPAPPRRVRAACVRPTRCFRRALSWPQGRAGRRCGASMVW